MKQDLSQLFPSQSAALTGRSGRALAPGRADPVKLLDPQGALCAPKGQGANEVSAAIRRAQRAGSLPSAARFSVRLHGFVGRSFLSDNGNEKNN